MSILQEKSNGGIQIIHVGGRLDQDQTPSLETVLDGLLDAGQRYLLVDLTETTYINSGGLRCLVSAWRRAREQEGDLALCGLNERLQEIFSMVGFDKLFQIYPTAVEAQKAMQDRF